MHSLNRPEIRGVIYQALLLVGAVLAALGFVSMDAFTDFANQVMQILPAVLLIGQSILAKRYLQDRPGRHRKEE